MKAIKIIAASIMLLCGALFANAQPGGARGQRGGGQQFDPEQMVQMRVDRLKETLKLTADQVTKVTAVFKKQNEDMAKLMQGGGQPDMEAFQKLREAENNELKKILTAEQFKAYEESMQRGFGGGRGQGGPGGREGIQMRGRQ